ncbi:TonB-dependent receptor [Fulvivirgaceae bacterium BMA12]|uniref:TonB-dependent receptor n=1 Tax=Agaribacillus aureus TaxID=3051825 RepID=A0ABT8L263_9BACT|nr:TonB-dependent receptor [Fulvivirgaceae bacterium BMA12]
MTKRIQNYAKTGVIALLCIFQFNAQCQNLATNKPIENPNGINSAQQLKTLKRCLKYFEQKYQVNFGYESKIVEGKNVEAIDIDAIESVENGLSLILTPHGLKYEKLGDAFYVILEVDKKSEGKRLKKLKKRAYARPNYQFRKSKIEKISNQIGKASVDRDISGKVISETGEGLPGVNIVVKETTVGTISNNDGTYKLTVPDNASTLVFSYIGYLPQEIAINNRSVIDVTLSPDIEMLSEVVVVGYGSQRKSDLTGAVSSITGDEITQLPLQRVDEALKGRVAGVDISTTDGSPGGNVRIRVRGANSINSTNEALVVIDGFQGGDLVSLNPNDIQSIEVLKDASATAIYGSRGANGVILVTTKRGKKGKPKIDYHYNFGIQDIRKKLDVMNAAEFARNKNELALTYNITVPESERFIFTDAEIAEFERNGGTDMQDEIYRTAFMHNHQLSLSGGNDNVNYLVSGALLNQEGILLNSNYDRYSLRANVFSKVSEKLNFGLNFVATHQSYNSPPFNNFDVLGSAINGATRWAPTVPVFDEDGNYNTPSDGPGNTGFTGFNWVNPDPWNPVASATEPDMRNNTTDLLANLYLEYEFFEGLKLKVTGGALSQRRNFRSYFNTKTRRGLQANGDALIAEEEFLRIQNSNILTYDKTFSDKHHVTLTGVAEQSYTNVRGSQVGATGIIIDNLGFNNIGGAASTTAGSYGGDRSLISYLGRINYVFDDRYLITASVRSDGSSVLSEGNRWSSFPSVALAWRMSEESFIRDLGAISNLKLRASWGITGSQSVPIGASQAVLITDDGGGDPTGANGYPINGNDIVISARPAQVANPNLGWEETEQIDFGFDLGLFDNRLTLSADYYKKNTTDLLFSKNVALYTGAGRIWVNAGEVQNQGVELLVSGNPLVGPVQWQSTFSFFHNQNEIVDLSGLPEITFRGTFGGGAGFSDRFMVLREGLPMGSIFGHEYLGVWKTSEREQALAFGQLPGQPKYADIDGNGQIDLDDRIILGQTTPKYFFGWTNNFSYKDFELNFFFQGATGHKIVNQAQLRMNSPTDGISRDLLNHWTPDNQNTDVPGFIDQQTIEDQIVTPGIESKVSGVGLNSRYVEDGSYIRLKTITLAYNLPSSKCEKIGIRGARIYVTATNYLTITDYTGYDPEVSSFNGGRNGQLNIRTTDGSNPDAQFGVDQSSYPNAKVITLGANISF